ncbi:MAG TPA: ubiquinol-cytochrome C chaperone family protein [Pseudolabrys sp.]|nr:ubiquinol-cytochrome C chaperone family protein [Pseudolabrys sp.]
MSALYGTIVAQARLPAFYQDYAVPDTVNGRFDVIVRHLTAVLERIAAEPSLREVGQGLFDRFWQDMDHNLREMGVGDLAVPKRMKSFGQAYYGRAGAYRDALAQEDGQALAAALIRNIYGENAPAGAPQRLAAYLRQTVRELAEQSADALAGGVLRFPDPHGTSAPDEAKV